ncbi:MAG TPA: Hsp70 family protein [Natronosporangium sp.]|nr:Hsp70 family protein [Natronosporangium sp.]
MTYALGIDLGTTYTAAATWRDGRAEIASLGSRAAVIPSVVLLREDETVLTGETAHRRGLTEPHRVSREFKRRLGDTTPILLGGVPYSAEALLAKLLRAVVDDVTAREGGPASAICISHPANWGPYKKDLLQQGVRLSGVTQPVTMTTEPEAAAVFYAAQQRVEPGSIVAVYDLGGGTFDAAVLRKTEAGFEILGQPEGIERLGGIDFDAAVFNHVRQALGGKLEELDEDDPTAIAAVARLREECVAAKEALSSDTDATIPVLLPNISTEVRLTRAEFEAMLRPILGSSIEALRRALQSAQVPPEQVQSVLLVGGSSRIPLVAQMVSAELGRPVAVDAHPKHAVALGAAWLASGAAPMTAGDQPPGAAAAAAAGPTPPAPNRPTYAGTAAVPTVPVGQAAAAAPTHAAAPTSPPEPPTAQIPPASPTSPPPRPPMSATAPMPAASASAAIPAPRSGYADYDPPGGAYAPPAPPAPPGGPESGSRRRLLLIGGVALAVVLAAGTVAWAVSNRGGEDPGGGGEAPQATGGPGAAEPQPSADAQPTQDAGPEPTEAALPPDEQCTDAIQANEMWVCITSAAIQGGELVIHYNAEWAGQVPTIQNGFHLHIYGGDGTTPPDHTMGTHADQRGDWVIKDTNPAVLTADEVSRVIGDYPKVCARIANGDHQLVPDTSGGYTTGNCWPIQR